MLLNVQSVYIERFGNQPRLQVRAPGRVNLLGEHVDYNDGPVLPAAIDRSVHLAAHPTGDGAVELYAHDFEAQVTFTPESLADKKDHQGRPLPSWALYPAGVAWSLRDAGLEVPGIRAVYTSNIPVGAGLSSSAAVEVAFALAWQTLGGWELDRMTLAQLCQRAENEYVGVACGLMDQFASLHGVAGHVLHFDTRSLEWEALPLPPRTTLVIADTGISRDLAASVYNQRRQECQQALQILKDHMPGIESWRDVSPTAIAAYSLYLPPVIRRRAEHVVKEIDRVESAVNMLHREEWRSFGAKMYAAHASLRDLYEVSLPELDTLVEIARGLPGCIGARLTGAGFGGCTVNLLEEAATSDFVERLQNSYLERTGGEVKIYLCSASEGAKVV